MRTTLRILLLATGLVLCGCHTMEGFGQDLSILGSKITGKAQEQTQK